MKTLSYIAKGNVIEGNIIGGLRKKLLDFVKETKLGYRIGRTKPNHFPCGRRHCIVHSVCPGSLK